MKKGFNNNNSGMTLVELIVAVGIFVAAIVPMLYAFVYSTGFNFKSQKTMQATGIAQAVLEQCKSLNFDLEDLENVLQVGGDTILDGSEFNVNGGEGVNGGYYWLYGVRAASNGESGSRREYDVAIETLAVSEGNTDYSSIQSMGHTTYNFGMTLSSVLKNEDRLAQQAALAKIHDLFTDGNITCSETLPSLPSGTLASFFSNADIDPTKIVLDREIIITVCDPDHYTNATTGAKTSVKVVVNYYAGYDSGSDGIADTPNFRVVHDAVIGGHTYHLVISKPLDQDYTYGLPSSPATPNPIYSVDMEQYYAFNEAASAVYFYYFPGFKSVDSSTANFRDHFVIDNNMTGNGTDHAGNHTIDKLDFYLFRQYDRELYDASPVVYDGVVEAYKCDITMNTAQNKTYLYHNLLWKVVEDVSHTPHIFKLTNITASDIVTFNSSSGCVNCTVADSAYTTYADSYKHVDTTWTYPNDNGISHVLSNYAALPYLHIDHPDPANGIYELFPTRMRVIVRVYPAGNIAAGNEIEIMTAEVLNW